jgi:hypothetical protein
MIYTAKRKMFIISLFSLFVYFSVFASDFENIIIKLNPEYKLKRSSNGVVILSAINNGEKTEHKFTDLYADIILAAYRKQRLGYIMRMVTKKYAYSEEDCRREIKHALNVLIDWNIIIREPQMASLN